MLAKLHNHLLNKSYLYSKYHSTRFHNHIHWGVFGFVSTMLSMKILAVLLAITFISLLPVTQSLAAPINKTWDTQSDWSPWSKDQTSSDVTAGAVTLAPDTSVTGTGTIYPESDQDRTINAVVPFSVQFDGNCSIGGLDGQTFSYSVFYPDSWQWEVYNSQTFSSSDLIAWENHNDVSNGGVDYTDNANNWSMVIQPFSDTYSYTCHNTSGYGDNFNLTIPITIPANTPAGSYSIEIDSQNYFSQENNGGGGDPQTGYVGGVYKFRIANYYPKGTALTTYDGQSDGSTSSSYIWSDLTKSDAADVDETITYYALADNSSSDPTVPTATNAGTESNWTTDGWTKLTFSSNVADLTSLTNTRYLHIASYLATTDTTKTPSVNSLSLNYTLANITVTSPNGGETWYYSQAKDFTKLITWSLDGATSDDHIHLQYSTDNGATWSDITGATDLDYTDTSFTWTLPKVDTTQAQIKAILENSSNTAIATDINDANFSLKPMSITITSPENPDCYLVGPGDTITGCATTTPGLTKTITWTTQGASQADHIKIEYSTNNGSTWTTLAASLPNSALSYDWTLPTNIKSTQALVRGTLEDSSNLDLADDSTGTFTIHSNIKPTISPTDPSDGTQIN